MTRWSVGARTLAKTGAPPGVNQDQVATHVVRTGRSTRLRLALADGATNAARSDEWAKLLAEAFASGTVKTNQTGRRLLDGMGAAALDWNDSKSPRSDTWYDRAFEARGSFAAVVAVEVDWRGSAWSWTALAIGDTNLFVVDRDSALVRAFPITTSGEFGSHPILASTTPAANIALNRKRLRATGMLPPGGSILLATDALAEWALREEENGTPPWNHLRDVHRSDLAFADFVLRLRSSSSIADDDTTLLIAERRG